MSALVSNQIKDQSVVNVKPIATKNGHVHERCPVEDYKKHVRGLQSLESILEALWKRAENEETELAQIKAANIKLSKDLAQAKNDLDEANKSLKAARQESENTKQKSKKECEQLQREKAKMAEEITNLQGSLVDVKKERDSKQANLEVITAELKEERENSIKAAADAQESYEKLEKILNGVKAKLADTRTSNHNLEHKIEGLNKDIHDLNQKYERVDGELDAANAKISEMEKMPTDVAKLQADLNTYLPPVGKRSQRVYIDKAIYGGVVLEKPDVLEAIQKAADNRSKFTVTNDSCGGDPWKGTRKTFVVSYITGGKGPMKYYCAQEGNTVEFP